MVNGCAHRCALSLRSAASFRCSVRRVRVNDRELDVAPRGPHAIHGFVRLIGISVLLAVPSFAWAAENVAVPTEPTFIAGGQEASTCEWPTAVSLRSFDQPFCTATLVHPRVVLLAAHCIDPNYGWGTPEAIGLGEDGFAPVAEIAPSFCGWPPQWDEGYSEGFDVAYCVLSQAVELDFVPPLMGCEWDAMVPGADVTIVGYGATVGVAGDFGWEYIEGGGPKRTAPQVLEEVLDNGVYLLGNDAGGCPGDSGGPAMIQMSDGTWRVIGAASRIQSWPEPPADGNSCGYGTVYSSFAHVMPWLEEQTGFDITPCHDADGTWNPDERCGGFPLTPQDAAATSGTWKDGCATADLSDPGALCGPAFEEPEPETTGAESTTGSDEPTGSSSTGSESEPMDSSTSEPEGSSGAEPLPGGTAASSSGDASDSSNQDGDGADDGCGCRTRSGGAPGTWGLLGLVGLMRRRRSARSSPENEC